MTPLRVVVNGRFLAQPVTGVQRYARELMATLDDELAGGLHDGPDGGLDVEIVTPRLDAAPPAYRHLRVRAGGRLTGHAWEQLELPRLARGADVLLCPGNTAPLALLRPGTRTATVVTVHDLAFRDFPETVSRSFRLAYEVLVPAVLRRATRVITVSEAERARLLTTYPDAGPRLRAVANGGLPRTEPVAAPGDPVPPVGPYVLYVGAFNPRKNVEGVLAACRALMVDRPDLRAVLVGGGAGIYQAVEVGAGAAGDDRFVLPGKVGDAALVAYYRAASVLLFPSFHEASGLPPVEAMANGCPVVVSDIAALRERCGDAALYCDPHDVASIVAATARVLDDAVLARRLSDAGRERAAGFTWASCLAQTLDVVREAAAVSR